MSPENQQQQQQFSVCFTLQIAHNGMVHCCLPAFDAHFQFILEFPFEILTLISFIVIAFIRCQNSNDSKPIQIVQVWFMHCRPFFIVIYNVDQPTNAIPLPISVCTHFECQTSTGGSFVRLFVCFHAVKLFTELCELITIFFKWQIFNYIARFFLYSKSNAPMHQLASIWVILWFTVIKCMFDRFHMKVNVYSRHNNNNKKTPIKHAFD